MIPLAITIAISEGNTIAKATAEGKISAKAIAEDKIISKVLGQFNINNFERSYHLKVMKFSGFEK